MKANLQIGQLDATEHYSIFSRYGLRATPTLILFKDGTVQWQYVGALSKADLRDRVASAMAS